MSADFAELRARMVDGQLRTTDVTDPTILDAMGALPREIFVDDKPDSYELAGTHPRLTGEEFLASLEK